MTQLPKLILASGSPRRAEILRSVGWDFTKITADIDESEVPGESPHDYVTRLAREKAERVASEVPGGIVLGADTTVVIDDKILGKPVDVEDARRMIRLLAGREHEVLTGIALVKNSVSGGTNKTLFKTSVGIQSTKVKFFEMTENEVDFLAENGDPLDKAGAYAVQAQAALFIEGIVGDYWNVVGLPISLVYKLAKEIED